MQRMLQPNSIKCIHGVCKRDRVGGRKESDCIRFTEFPIVWSYLKTLIAMCEKDLFLLDVEEGTIFHESTMEFLISLSTAQHLTLVRLIHLLQHLAFNIGLLSFGAKCQLHCLCLHATIPIFLSLSGTTEQCVIASPVLPFSDSHANSQALSPLFLLSAAPNISILILLQTIPRSLMFYLGSPKSPSCSTSDSFFRLVSARRKLQFYTRTINSCRQS